MSNISAMTYQANIEQIQKLLFQLIKKHTNEKELIWLNQQTQKLQEDFNKRSFYLAFSTAARFFNKKGLQLSQATIEYVKQLRKGFQPEYWNLLQTVRTFLLLMLPHNDKDLYIVDLNKLFETADMDEQLALYAALPLLPHPEALAKRAAEGLRTNIISIFDAIALHNPYPADYLNEQAWNQMVLKAVFMQRPLFKIYGADERANPQLAKMLVDFAHERWAAGRKVMPELWRFVGPFLNEQYLPDIERTVTQGEVLEKEACLLACSKSSFPAAKKLLEKHIEINDKTLIKKSWQKIGEEYTIN